ncbi:hypothetical protein [Nocardioides nitrophenolicus]|uniref:hypothetical protein n=1 Tax=Nocardioides nitrophenolicus TaxID=60489 RepID=UPI000B3287FF|nr:hypothetical protein [Nocardioides nitrophenolicus]MBM7517877.1 hypothetical protein [Nocardioides nitrophenolicus]
MSRVVAILAALIAALFGVIGPGPTMAVAAPGVVTYGYDGHYDTAVLAYTTTDRGPPTYNHHTVSAYDARR